MAFRDTQQVVLFSVVEMFMFAFWCQLLLLVTESKMEQRVGDANAFQLWLTQ